MNRVGAASITALAFAASLLLARVHPFGDAGLFRAEASEPRIPQPASIPPDARAILVNKCADCHSTQTRSPLYGHFAPLSWLMERDIVEGRKHMNLSQWDTYSPDQQETFKAKIVQETKSHDMPLPQYRMIHWNTRITPADLQSLTRWAHDSPTSADSTPPTTAPGEPTRGAQVFLKRCSGCHALTQNHEGPRLQGVYGRNTGSIAGFLYSDALRNANIQWNDASLERWLADPDAFLPGNNMDFHDPRPQERKDLIAYFKQSAGK